MTGPTLFFLIFNGGMLLMWAWVYFGTDEEARATPSREELEKAYQEGMEAALTEVTSISLVEREVEDEKKRSSVVLDALTSPPPVRRQVPRLKRKGD